MAGQTLPARRPARLPRWLADELEDALVAGDFDARPRMPTEPEIAAEYGVSRQVVREAARLLEDRGLVEIAPGRGMTIARMDADSIARRYRSVLRRDRSGFEHLMQLRSISEIDMTALAAAQRADDDVEAMRGVLERAAQHLDDFTACLDADLEFHVAVARATGNPLVLAFMQPINTALRDVYREPIGYLATQESTLREHRAIANAIADRDEQAARAAAAAHLDRVRSDAARLIG